MWSPFFCQGKVEKMSGAKYGKICLKLMTSTKVQEPGNSTVIIGSPELKT